METDLSWRSRLLPACSRLARPTLPYKCIAPIPTVRFFERADDVSPHRLGALDEIVELHLDMVDVPDDAGLDHMRQDIIFTAFNVDLDQVDPIKREFCENVSEPPDIDQSASLLRFTPFDRRSVVSLGQNELAIGIAQTEVEALDLRVPTETRYASLVKLATWLENVDIAIVQLRHHFGKITGVSAKIEDNRIRRQIVVEAQSFIAVVLEPTADLDREFIANDLRHVEPFDPARGLLHQFRREAKRFSDDKLKLRHCLSFGAWQSA
ncbi:hypothetical protein QTL95_08690 [Rhizobium sp. S152]|nr:hypothetical protein [Rhizobium sp. S152]